MNFPPSIVKAQKDKTKKRATIDTEKQRKEMTYIEKAGKVE